MPILESAGDDYYDFERGDMELRIPGGYSEVFPYIGRGALKKTVFELMPVVDYLKKRAQERKIRFIKI